MNERSEQNQNPTLSKTKYEAFFLVLMALELVQPCVITPIPRTRKLTRTACKLTPSSQHFIGSSKTIDFSSGSRPIYTTLASKETSGILQDVSDEQKDEDYSSLEKIKASLYLALEGINRGIFGVTSAKKSEIESLVEMLESQNPTPSPTQNLEKVSGCWKLVYSTITILGSKRTKLGLRDFISLGDFLQIIDVTKGKAANMIKFNVRGLNILNGLLNIEASFKVSSESRVDINYDNSTITPDQLMNLFRQNYELLLGIFNPDGWLEITYVDDRMRIGRDDKGNIFILERAEDEP